MFRKSLKEKTQAEYNRGYAKCKDILTSEYDKKISDLKDEHEIEKAGLQASVDSMNRLVSLWRSEYKRMKKTETEAKILKKEMIQFAKDMNYAIDEADKNEKGMFGSFRGQLDKVIENKLLPESK